MRCLAPRKLWLFDGICEWVKINEMHTACCPQLTSFHHTQTHTDDIKLWSLSLHFFIYSSRKQIRSRTEYEEQKFYKGITAQDLPTGFLWHIKTVSWSSD